MRLVARAQEWGRSRLRSISTRRIRPAMRDARSASRATTPLGRRSGSRAATSRTRAETRSSSRTRGWDGSSTSRASAAGGSTTQLPTPMARRDMPRSSQPEPCRTTSRLSSSRRLGREAGKGPRSVLRERPQAEFWVMDEGAAKGGTLMGGRRASGGVAACYGNLGGLGKLARFALCMPWPPGEPGRARSGRGLRLVDSSRGGLRGVENPWVSTSRAGPSPPPGPQEADSWCAPGVAGLGAICG